jgi:hypothetical protein
MPTITIDLAPDTYKRLKAQALQAGHRHRNCSAVRCLKPLYKRRKQLHPSWYATSSTPRGDSVISVPPCAGRSSPASPWMKYVRSSRQRLVPPSATLSRSNGARSRDQ